MESGIGFPVSDESHGIHVKQSPLLSPQSPFTLEMWIQPKSGDAFPNEIRPVLMDSKYVPVEHRGFMWSLSAAIGKSRQITLAIGLGERTETWFSKPVELLPKWQHLAVSYDAVGTVTFYLNGSIVDRVTKSGAGPMWPATRSLSIGDRLGSNYNGFPGWIDEVRITRGVRDFRPVVFHPQSNRFVFVRMNGSAMIVGDVVNQTSKPLSASTLIARLPEEQQKAIPLPEIAAGAKHRVEFPFDTSLKPGEYTVSVETELVAWRKDSEGYRTAQELPVVIVRRPLPHRMPVVMWGIGGVDNVIEEIPRLKDLGFTHCLGLRTDYQSVWDQQDRAVPDDETLRQSRNMLDIALENDIQVVASLSPGHWLRTAEVGKPFQRIDRNGKHYGREDVSGLFPDVQAFCFNTGAMMGRAYGDHPALAAALLHSEVRGESQVSFHPLEVEAYKQISGSPIPLEVTIKNGVDYKQLKRFPENRVISDDDPILKYLRWFWKSGDGWNGLNSQLHEGLKQHIKRKDFWTFYDPACRVPSLGGSGGNVDVLSHWTYSYPDPIRIGLCADELFEMARVGGKQQQVMKMTQLIWYRSQTAPIDASAPENASPWVDQDPDAAYITVAPMHLREAFWWKIARPIQGIMYHGWQSLVENESTSAYRYTNPNTQHELRRLVRDVVVPLGPTLRQIPDAASDVVFLESFTSQMFARRGTYGWNHTWAGDLYHVLMYAQLQPRVMYEESLLSGGLRGAKVLVLADCDVLTQSAVAAIKQFQTDGGLIIADADVCPEIKPDKVIARFNREKQADAGRKQLLDAAADLRNWLDSRYQREVDSTNANVVTRRRQFESTDYVFAVNDLREFGNYVGGYGLVMEDGLPSEANVLLNRESGFVYDLTSQRQIAPILEAEHLNVPIDLGPCDGKLLMITERPIQQVQLTVPKEAERRSSVPIRIQITDGNDNINAVVPVRLSIVDPEGREVEGSGYYGAANGELSLTIDVAPNDRTGLWRVEAEELASGKLSTEYIRVRAGK
ncbi:MAG: LamG-like jellyroll fold domain-containing protein [Pirellulaceae bacterium]